MPRQPVFQSEARQALLLYFNSGSVQPVLIDDLLNMVYVCTGISRDILRQELLAMLDPEDGTLDQTPDNKSVFINKEKKNV